MAWTAPITWTNAVLTAAQLNQQLRDNMLETAPAKAAFSTEYFVATGANAIAGRRILGASINTVQAVTSGTYSTTSMPTVTVASGTVAVVMLMSYMTLSSNSTQGFIGYEVSGDSSVAGNDQRALSIARFSSDFAFTASAVIRESGLTVGTNNVFTACARVTGGTLTTDTRRIAVMPF